MKLISLFLCFYISTAQAEADLLTEFTLRGRLSVVSDNNAVILSFTWKQSGDQYQINLSGPMHSFQARIEGNDNFAELKSSKLKQKIFSYSPDTMFEDYFGMPFPILNLKYWIQAKAVPGSQVSYQGAFGKKNYIIEQDGWHMRYTKFASVGEVNLPRKLKAQNQSSKVKMVLKDWTLSK